MKHSRTSGNSPCWKTIVTSLSTPLAIVLFLIFLLPYLVSGAPPTTVGLLAGAGGLGDQSYNDMTMSGLGRARQLFDFTLIVEETGSSKESQVNGLEQLLKQGSEVVVANGAGLGLLVVEYSKNYPDVLFLVNDFVIEDIPNVASTVFAHEEGSFLAGMLAALVLPEGNLGFIGGVEMEAIYQFFNGFAKGAGYVSPDIHISSAFVSPAGDFSGFTNPERGQEIAQAMYQRGVDIIFAVAGLTGNGVIQAAREHQKLMIGVDADQDHMAKGYVLTSMMKRLDQSTYNEMVKIANGEFSPGVTHYSLANGGISLSPMRFTRHLVSDEMLERIKNAEQDIVSGKLSISNLPLPEHQAIGTSDDSR